MCGICFNRTQFDVKKGFDEFIRKYSVKNLNHRLHFLKGDAAALITDLAAKERIDLIIMDGLPNKRGGFFYWQYRRKRTSAGELFGADGEA